MTKTMKLEDVENCYYVSLPKFYQAMNASTERLKWRPMVPTKGKKLRNVKTHNVVWANQKTESRVYRWLCALAMFELACYSAIGAFNAISLDTLINV